MSFIDPIVPDNDWGHVSPNVDPDEFIEDEEE